MDHRFVAIATIALCIALGVLMANYRVKWYWVLPAAPLLASILMPFAGIVNHHLEWTLVNIIPGFIGYGIGAWRLSRKT